MLAFLEIMGFFGFFLWISPSTVLLCKYPKYLEIGICTTSLKKKLKLKCYVQQEICSSILHIINFLILFNFIITLPKLIFRRGWKTLPLLILSTYYTSRKNQTLIELISFRFSFSIWTQSTSLMLNHIYYRNRVWRGNDCRLVPKWFSNGPNTNSWIESYPVNPELNPEENAAVM